MGLPYENATSGDRAYADIQKILGRFGCDNYGIMQKAKDRRHSCSLIGRGAGCSYQVIGAATPLTGYVNILTRPACVARSLNIARKPCE